MRVLITGATGFVGRWLIRELAAAGHEPIGTPDHHALDLADRIAFGAFLRTVEPDAVAHLAGVSFGPDAARAPARATEVNVGGTETVLASIAESGLTIPVLVSGSSDVYARPHPHDLPLTEDAPTGPSQPYGVSKLAQERVALRWSSEHDVPVVVTRSFNHTGPGQRPEFVAPALAHRVLAARRAGVRSIPVGNIDVLRDISDVRDVVRAYRLLLEGLATKAIDGPTVVNVATGRSVAIRQLLDMLCVVARWNVEPVVDAALVRPSDPSEIVGDPSRLTALTDWRPTIGIAQTLADLMDSVEAGEPPLRPAAAV
jgi:GDP-4-dehydro-6-deoxy-D-mannose reductase